MFPIIRKKIMHFNGVPLLICLLENITISYVVVFLKCFATQNDRKDENLLVFFVVVVVIYYI
jgi:hypothetical protein